MAVDKLATQTDVVAALGRDLTESEVLRVEPILEKAGELFRRHSGQQFTPGTSEVRLRVNGGRVYLQQRPASSITSVVDDCGAAVEYTVRKQWLTVPLASDKFVIVDYVHGGPVPDVVRLAVADIARKVLSIHEDAVAGKTQSSSTGGPYSESATYAAWAVGGQTMLSPDDLALARSFRVKIPKVTVMVP